MSLAITSSPMDATTDGFSSFFATPDAAAVEKLKEMHRSQMRSMSNLQDKEEARKMSSDDTVRLPLIVFGANKTKKGDARIVTAMVAPFALHPKLNLGVNAVRLPGGQRAIEIVKDIRSKEKREEDKRVNYDLNLAPVVNINDVDDQLDPDGKIRRTRQLYPEGQLFAFRDTSGDSRLAPGSIIVAAIETMMWHAKDTKKVTCIRNLRKVVECVSMPTLDMVASMHRNDLFTHQLQTVCALFYNKSRERALSEAEKKALQYSDNFVILPVGLPDDYRNPRYLNMRPNSCLVKTVSNASDAKTFRFTSVKDNKNDGEEQIQLALDFEILQWRGEKKTPVFEPATDKMIMVFARVFQEQLRPIGITAATQWHALMKNTFDLLVGVFVGREDTSRSATNELNKQRLDLSAASNGGVARHEDINSSCGRRAPSFALYLNPSAFLFDPVMFVRTVAARVSPARLMQYWAAKNGSEDEATHAPRHPSLKVATLPASIGNATLISLSEMDPSADLGTILRNPDCELRAFTSAYPIDAALKREAYEALSHLSVEDGDLFFDFVDQVLFNKENREVYFELHPEIGPTHPARKYVWATDNIEVAYFYAINTKLLAAEHTQFESQVKRSSIDLSAFATLSASAPASLKRPLPDAAAAAASNKKPRLETGPRVDHADEILLDDIEEVRSDEDEQQLQQSNHGADDIDFM